MHTAGVPNIVEFVGTTGILRLWEPLQNGCQGQSPAQNDCPESGTWCPKAAKQAGPGVSSHTHAYNSHSSIQAKNAGLFASTRVLCTAAVWLTFVSRHDLPAERGRHRFGLLVEKKK